MESIGRGGAGVNATESLHRDELTKECGNKEGIGDSDGIESD